MRSARASSSRKVSVAQRAFLTVVTPKATESTRVSVEVAEGAEAGIFFEKTGENVRVFPKQKDGFRRVVAELDVNSKTTAEGGKGLAHVLTFDPDTPTSETWDENLDELFETLARQHLDKKDAPKPDAKEETSGSLDSTKDQSQAVDEAGVDESAVNIPPRVKQPLLELDTTAGSDTQEETLSGRCERKEGRPTQATSAAGRVVERALEANDDIVNKEDVVRVEDRDSSENVVERALEMVPEDSVWVEDHDSSEKGVERALVADNDIVQEDAERVQDFDTSEKVVERALEANDDIVQEDAEQGDDSDSD